MVWSLSARRAWIEINTGATNHGQGAVALRKESVDRNYRRFRAIQHPQMSLSARRAWIEISTVIVILRKRNVALRKESVDRNKIRITPIDSIINVALRKESVDRNGKVLKKETGPIVALRKESVDRNY